MFDSCIVINKSNIELSCAVQYITIKKKTFQMRRKLIEAILHYITSLLRYLGLVKYILSLSVNILSGERTAGLK